MDNFAALLKELGSVINVALHPDHIGACKLIIEGKHAVQIEYDPFKDRLLLISFLFEIPPGKFREIVMKESLRANGVYPRTATLAFNDKNSFLTLFDFYSLVELKIEKLVQHLYAFIEKAKYWRNQLESGVVPSVVSAPSKELPSPFFKNRPLA